MAVLYSPAPDPPITAWYPTLAGEIRELPGGLSWRHWCPHTDRHGWRRMREIRRSWRDPETNSGYQLPSEYYCERCGIRARDTGRREYLRPVIRFNDIE